MDGDGLTPTQSVRLMNTRGKSFCSLASRTCSPSVHHWKHHCSPRLREGAWWKLVLLHSGMHLRHIKYLRKFISVWGGCSVLKCCSSQESAASPVHGLRKMVTNSFFFFFFKGKIKRKKQKGLRNVGWQHRSKLESEDSFFRRCCWGLLHNTGVLSPFIITLLSAPGTELCLFRLPHSFLSPLQKFLGKLQSSQARVVELLVLGPGLLSCLHEAIPLQRIKMSSVVPTVVDAVFLTAGSYSCCFSALCL